eukprot:864699-Prorocentrum_lima.AAC.1
MCIRDRATPAGRSGHKGSVLPYKMVFVRKFLTAQQMKETGTNKTWKAKSRIVMCGTFASENEVFCDSASTQNVEI